MTGKFITIEGIEGAGKSTAIADIEAFFEKNNIDAVFTREPGGTVIAEEIRSVLLHPAGDERMQPTTELLLMFAARAQLVNHVIRPALKAGKWVVSDRFVDASYAYQGYGRGIDLYFIEQLDETVVGHTEPDLTLLLDVPAELGLERAASRGQGKDRIESEKVDFFNRVREGYLQRAKNKPQRFKVIDASKTPKAAAKEITAALEVLLCVE